MAAFLQAPVLRKSAAQALLTVLAADGMLILPQIHLTDLKIGTESRKGRGTVLRIAICDDEEKHLQKTAELDRKSVV